MDANTGPTQEQVQEFIALQQRARELTDEYLGLLPEVFARERLAERYREAVESAKAEDKSERRRSAMATWKIYGLILSRLNMTSASSMSHTKDDELLKLHENERPILSQAIGLEKKICELAGDADTSNPYGVFLIEDENSFFLHDYPHQFSDFLVELMNLANHLTLRNMDENMFNTIETKNPQLMLGVFGVSFG